MSDEADIAAEYTQAWLDSVGKPEGNNIPPGNDGLCVECGESNQARASLGYGRCIDCQEEAERWAR